MNLYTLFEGSDKKKVAEDFNGLQYGVQENDGLSGALSTDNGVAAVQGTDNDISPIGSGFEYQDDEHVTEDHPVELDEVAMNPSAFAKAVKSGAEKGVLVGFEFETLMPKATVNAWKNGPQVAAAGYDATSTTWIDGKTTNDLFDGIARVGEGNNGMYQKVFDDLFKYKNSVANTEGNKSVWDHYRKWSEVKVREELDAATASGVNPVIVALKKLLKDREFSNTEVGFMDADGERQYGVDAEGNPTSVKAKPFVLRVLKDKTGIDFSGRVAKSQLTPEAILKIIDAMRYCYRITRGPVDTRCSQVANAENGRKDEIWASYIPGWSYSITMTPELLSAIKNHFSEFCTAKMGTDDLKTLLKTKWAFKGRVNNNTETLKEKLWYYVTPGAEQPRSLQQHRSRYNSSDYMDGAEFLKANLKDAFGDNMVIFRGYHQEAKRLDRWYIEPDGSLRPNSGDYAAEVVSPPLKADAAMAALKTWYEKAQALDFYTNGSTGLHINVSIPDKIDVLKLAVFSGDQHVLKQFGREDNSYARSVIKSLKNQGSLPTIGMGTFKNAEKQMKELVTNISRDHFATVNFNGKYVSFRHAGGNYLGKQADITNTVGRFIRAMIIASDPTAYRDEYIQKLVKMMKTPEVATGDKLGLTDIRAVAERGIPIQYIDFVATQGTNPQEAVSAAVEYAKSNYGANKVNIKGGPDPSARERLAADRGFSASTKEYIETTDAENFFRLEIVPSTRRSLESFANRFTTYGTDRGSAFGMYGQGRDKRAVGVTAMTAVKQTDSGFVDAVKALRGEPGKPLPLPGTKAAPKAKAEKFTSQQPAGQEPAAQEDGQWGVFSRGSNAFIRAGGNPFSRTAPIVSFSTQAAAQAWARSRNISPDNIEIRVIPADGSQTQPSSDDESEPAGGQQWELYHINSGDIVTQGTRPVTFTADRLSHAQDAMATWMRERGMPGNGYNVRPVTREESAEYRFEDGDDELETMTFRTVAGAMQHSQTLANLHGSGIRVYNNETNEPIGTCMPGEDPQLDDDEDSGTDARDTYRFVDADTGRILDTEQGLSEESALERAEELVRQYNVEVVVYNYRDQEVERISPDELDDYNNDTARETWTLNNGEMVRHYDPSQVNSERAYELAREMYSQYGHPVTISRDGTTYGHWPRQQQDAEAGPQFYRFMNPSNGHTVHSGRYDSDQEAEHRAQDLANRVNGEILVLRVTATGPDRRLGVVAPRSSEEEYYSIVTAGTRQVIARGDVLNDLRVTAQQIANRQNIQLQIMNPDGQVVGAAITPQELTEARIFHADEKVNVVYQPHNSKASVIVAKAVDHLMAKKVIDSYVHRNQQNSNRAPLSAKDFVLNPAKGYTTAESQDGSGVTSPGGDTAIDSTSPIHGFNEDGQPMSQTSRELLRVARQSNPEALSDTDAINAYMSSIAKKTQDNYKQVNNILRQLDPLSTELDQTERELNNVERVNATQQDLLRRLSQRVNQVNTQTLPSQKRAADVPAQKAAAQGEKEREVITKTVDEPKQKQQAPVAQTQQPAQQGDVADTTARNDIAKVNQYIKDLEQKLHAKDVADAAKAEIIRNMHKAQSAIGAANPDKIRALAQSIRNPDTQQTLPFDEDMYESRIYAMKRAGYDFL